MHISRYSTYALAPSADQTLPEDNRMSVGNQQSCSPSDPETAYWSGRAAIGGSGRDQPLPPNRLACSESKRVVACKALAIGR